MPFARRPRRGTAPGASDRLDADTGFASAINRENVAEEVVAALVGSIGLIAALSLTTALAACSPRGLPADALPADALPADAHVH